MLDSKTKQKTNTANLDKDKLEQIKQPNRPCAAKQNEKQNTNTMEARRQQMKN